VKRVSAFGMGPWNALSVRLRAKLAVQFRIRSVMESASLAARLLDPSWTEARLGLLPQCNSGRGPVSLLLSAYRNSRLGKRGRRGRGEGA